MLSRAMSSGCAGNLTGSLCRCLRMAVTFCAISAKRQSSRLRLITFGKDIPDDTESHPVSVGPHCCCPRCACYGCPCVAGLYPGGIFPRAGRGKIIVVDVHAVWCPTCKAQAPTLDALRQDAQLKDAVFFRVDFDKEKAFLREHRIPRQSTVLVFRGKQETARSIAESRPRQLRDAVLAGL